MCSSWSASRRTLRATARSSCTHAAPQATERRHRTASHLWLRRLCCECRHFTVVSAFGLRLDKRSALGLTGICAYGEVAGWDGAGPPKGCMLSDDNLTWTCQSMLAHLRTCGCGSTLLTRAMHCGTTWHVAYITQRDTYSVHHETSRTTHRDTAAGMTRSTSRAEHTGRGIHSTVQM